MKPSYRQFIFERYEFDAAAKQLTLHYSLDGKLQFTEIFRFNFEFTDYNSQALDQACFGLFMVAGVSYYKTALPPEIVIKHGQLTSVQADFFDRVYRHGLGELYAQNQITPPHRIDFPISKQAITTPADTPVGTGAILPVGGGKDSLVTLELLRQAGIDFETWVLGHTSLLQPLLDRIGGTHLPVTRILDPQIAKLNREGAYNGHIPISAVLAFTGVVSAILRGRRDIVLSNEASAGELNLEYRGIAVNHQYSKTLEFERLFQDYLGTAITPSVRYFSFLRPMSELRIAELFCGHWLAKYQGVFTSCNRNFKQGNTQPLRWCGECPKCAFVFLIFAPFLPKAKLVDLFGGKNLFAEPKLARTYRELLGIEGHKPFDCVGEVRECRQAVVMARKKGNYPELDQFEFPPVEYDYRALQEQAMPDEYYHLLTSYLDANPAALTK